MKSCSSPIPSPPKPLSRVYPRSRPRSEDRALAVLPRHAEALAHAFLERAASEVAPQRGEASLLHGRVELAEERRVAEPLRVGQRLGVVLQRVHRAVGP